MIDAQIRHATSVRVKRVSLRQRMKADPALEILLFAQLDRRADQNGSDTTVTRRIEQILSIPRRVLDEGHVNEVLALLTVDTASLAC